MMPVGLGGDRFLIWNGRRARSHLDTVTILEQAQLDAKVLLAESAQHGFVRRLHMFNFQRGILRRELAQRFAHLGLSALARTFDRKAEHRLGHDQRAQAKITADRSVV